jgi:hypothetical protein
VNLSLRGLNVAPDALRCVRWNRLRVLGGHPVCPAAPANKGSVVLTATDRSNPAQGAAAGAGETVTYTVCTNDTCTRGSPTAPEAGNHGGVRCDRPAADQRCPAGSSPSSHTVEQGARLVPNADAGGLVAELVESATSLRLAASRSRRVPFWTVPPTPPSRWADARPPGPGNAQRGARRSTRSPGLAEDLPPFSATARRQSGLLRRSRPGFRANSWARIDGTTRRTGVER